MSFQNKTKGSFLLFWILATTIGVAGGITLSSFVQSRIPSFDTSFEMTKVLSFSRLLVANFAGILATCFQWAVLSTFIRRSYAWLVMGLIGWCFPFVAIILLTIFPIKNVGFAFDFSAGISSISYVGAFAAGFLQWWTMRTWVRYASWWILVNTIAWMLANAVPHAIGSLVSLLFYFIFALPELIPRGFYSLREFSPLFFGIGAGITIGITSGTMVISLFQSTTASQNSPANAD